MKLGIVIPTFNRIKNLKIVLALLKKQTVCNFNVIIVDDGSTDNTRGEVENLTRKDFFWKTRLKWIGIGSNIGDRPGLARNIGAYNLPTDCSLMLMLDSDVILNEKALESYLAIHKKYAKSIIFGRVDWLPPIMTHDKIIRFIDEKGVIKLKEKIPNGVPQRVSGTFVGRDIRLDIDPTIFCGKSDQPIKLRPELTLTLNTCFPLDIFWEVGGFDTLKIGYGYDDIEMGIRAKKKKISCIFSSKCAGFHMWHRKNKNVLWEQNQKSLDYVLRKHGAFDVLEREIDWRCLFHYHRQRGGYLVRHNNSYWVVSGKKQAKIPVSKKTVENLGYTASEAEKMNYHDFKKIQQLKPLVI